MSYALDVTGTSSANRISDEYAYVTPGRELKEPSLIIPRAAPFFGANLEIYTAKEKRGTKLINGEDYITTAYAEGEIESYRPIYNLIIACNLKNNKIFYLYDSPKSENDNWKYDVETLDGAEFSWVTEKNPDWKQLD